MLSHPLLEKAEASTGPRLLFSQPQMMAEAVVVFPVPGGPWIKLKRLCRSAGAVVSKLQGRSMYAYIYILYILSLKTGVHLS